MKNSKLRRILLTLACAVLLVSLSVGATLAYLTSQTGVVTNTFTVGNVAITLDEGDVWEVDETGFTAENNGLFKDDGETRVTANEYKLIPGRTYDKDPTVHVAEGSEDAYIFVQVVNGFAPYEAETCIAAQMYDLGWREVAENIFCLTDSTTDDIGNAVVCEAGDNLVVFETFTMSGTLTDAEYAAAKDATITIKAFAIQAEGISAADPAAIWDLYSAQE